jgi:hypothetical protein
MSWKTFPFKLGQTGNLDKIVNLRLYLSLHLVLSTSSNSIRYREFDIVMLMCKIVVFFAPDPA